MSGKMAGEDLIHADASFIQYVGYHGPGRSHFSLPKFAKKPRFLAGVRGILLFDNGHKHQFAKIWPTVLTKGDDYGVHSYRKKPISALSWKKG